MKKPYDGIAALQRQISMIPKFMHPDYSLIATFDDLLYQLAHEIDLAEEGDLDWTPRQVYRAKQFTSKVHLLAIRDKEQRGTGTSNTVYDAVREHLEHHALFAPGVAVVTHHGRIKGISGRGLACVSVDGVTIYNFKLGNWLVDPEAEWSDQCTSKS